MKKIYLTLFLASASINTLCAMDVPPPDQPQLDLDKRIQEASAHNAVILAPLQPGLIVMICERAAPETRWKLAQTCKRINMYMRGFTSDAQDFLGHPYLIFDERLRAPMSRVHVFIALIQSHSLSFRDFILPKTKNADLIAPILQRLYFPGEKKRFNIERFFFAINHFQTCTAFLLMARTETLTVLLENGNNYYFGMLADLTPQKTMAILNFTPEERALLCGEGPMDTESLQSLVKPCVGALRMALESGVLVEISGIDGSRLGLTEYELVKEKKKRRREYLKSLSGYTDEEIVFIRTNCFKLYLRLLTTDPYFPINDNIELSDEIGSIGDARSLVKEMLANPGGKAKLLLLNRIHLKEHGWLLDSRSFKRLSKLDSELLELIATRPQQLNFPDGLNAFCSASEAGLNTQRLKTIYKNLLPIMNWEESNTGEIIGIWPNIKPIYRIEEQLYNLSKAIFAGDDVVIFATYPGSDCLKLITALMDYDDEQFDYVINQKTSQFISILSRYRVAANRLVVMQRMGHLSQRLLKIVCENPPQLLRPFAPELTEQENLGRWLSDITNLSGLSAEDLMARV